MTSAKINLCRIVTEIPSFILFFSVHNSMILKLIHFKIPGHLSECFREQGITKLTKSSMRTPLRAHSYQFTGTPRYASLKTDTPGLRELRWGGMSQWPLRTFLCPELKQLISQF